MRSISLHQAQNAAQAVAGFANTLQVERTIGQNVPS
jgi:hypothetical protein